MPPECEAELAVDAFWTLLEQQELGSKLGPTSETLAEASPAKQQLLRAGSGNTAGSSGCLRKGEISTTDPSLQTECLGAQKWAIWRESLHPEAIKMRNAQQAKERLQ